MLSVVLVLRALYSHAVQCGGAAVLPAGPGSQELADLCCQNELAAMQCITQVNTETTVWRTW